MPRKKIIAEEKPVETPVVATPEVPATVSLVASPKKSEYRYPGVEGPGVRVVPFNPGGDAENMYQELSKQPKVPLFVPFGLGERPGVEGWCQINGLAVWIKKNQMVMVPKLIQEVMVDSLQQTANALHPLVTNGDGQVVPADYVASSKELN